MSRLQDHYERKYATEALAVAKGAVVARTSRPTNRFEACIHYLPRVFAGGDVLEIGAGDGRIARTLLREGLAVASYTVTEFADSRLAGLRQSLPDQRVRVVRMDVENLSDAERASRYDVILMLAVVEHLVEPIAALRALRGMLRPGGLLYIDTPNIAKLARRVRLVLGQFPSTASRQEGLMTYDGHPTDVYDEGHLHYFTYRSLSRILTERCDFSSVQRCGYHLGTPLVGPVLGTLLARRWPTVFSEIALIAK